MPSLQKSVRLSEQAVETIKQISQHEINYNAAINNIAQRYALVCQHSLPELTEYQRLAIAQAFNGRLVSLENIEHEVKTVPWAISEAVKYDGNVVELLWKDHQDMTFADFLKSDNLAEFVEMANNWSFAEKMAVLHNALAFWSHDNLPEFDE
jgi:hypothetical protein